MNLIIAQAIDFVIVDGKQLLHAKKLDHQDEKYKTIMSLFKDIQIQFFLHIGTSLHQYLKQNTPLVFVTDWSDPSEMIGLLLEEDGKKTPYIDLGFLAFHTDWNDIEHSGIAEIFSHEFSHLWLYHLGFDFALSKSNKFHTVTSLTDQYMAFSEGFAEHLEIVSDDIKNSPVDTAIYDSGLDIESWISYRDSSLRKHAVMNNRFIYHTSIPYIEDYKTYGDLHLAHITSSSFTPERIKNGSQMMASEGVVASFFYHFYRDDFCKNQYCDHEFYEKFNTRKDNISTLENHYLKILYALDKIDLTSETILIDFMIKYSELFPAEAKQIFTLFLDITHYVLVDEKNKLLFEELYRIGKLGNPTKFKEQLLHVRSIKEDILKKVLDNPLILKNGIYSPIWIKGDEMINPVPWDDTKEPYIFDLNTASEIDLMSVKGIDRKKAEKIIKERYKIHGFSKPSIDSNEILKDLNLKYID